MKTKWDTDRIVGISAMIVGVGSLFIVIYQTALIREQQKAQALPYLLIAFNTNAAGSFIALRNVGHDDIDARLSGAGKAVLEIEYASVYGERWRVRSDRVTPEAL